MCVVIHGVICGVILVHALKIGVKQQLISQVT